LVAHCINDILTQGADPLFFLDYVSSSQLEPNAIVDIISGMVKACKEHSCALIGGELAEMPGLYRPHEYDLVGSISGIVNFHDLIDGKQITVGDVVLGLPSVGLHTNGYSLARKILLDQDRLALDAQIPGLGITVADELLKPHKCYYKVCQHLLDKKLVKGIAHITGGGLLDNIPRVLPENMDAQIDTKAWPHLPIFSYLTKQGQMDRQEAYQVFNMGIGLVLVVNPTEADQVINHCQNNKQPIYQIGNIISGNKKVVLT
jgi:phosphoribosylformylglycinamidine cyclo-ligase